MSAFFSNHATAVFIALALGWVALVIVLIILVTLVSKWKTAFNDKEWTLVPTLDAASWIERINKNTHAVNALADATHRAEETAQRTLEAAEGTRKEFGILGPQLDLRDQQITELRMGQEYHHRKALLLSAVRALTAISVDAQAEDDPLMTLAGIRIDLEEALEENHVEVVTPTIGATLPARGVDAGSARHIPTPDEALVGTIASVERPAYIARGPAGSEDVLRPAAVSVYITMEKSQ